VLRWVWPVITLGLLGYGLYVALDVVPADADQGNVGRILYYHVPTWIAMSACFLANLIGSIAYLATRKRSAEFSLKADALAVSSAEMGVVFCFLGMATGSLWGRVAWGIWWTWDARLTATLVLWLIYVAYLVLRNVVGGGDRMRTLAAVIAIFGYCDVPLVYMTNQVVAHATSSTGLLWRSRYRRRAEPASRRAMEHFRVARMGNSCGRHSLRGGTPQPDCGAGGRDASN
jgi:heme exporter protein C